ncbi:hypothetical protein HDU96_009035 [Phlyctochytrium bullatum]|nr:hypothetical protein HDU96_009035 [Phlyctochytrium bullatum]
MPKRKHVSPQVHAISGAVSGLISCVAVQPLDVLKTRLQQDRTDMPPWQGSSLRAISSSLGSKARYVASIVRSVVREDSVFGLWRGAGPTALRTVPGTAVYFTVLDKTKRGLQRLTGNGGFGAQFFSSANSINLVAGGLSRLTVGLVMMPITVIKVRYESSLFRYNSLSHAIMSIWKEDGIKGFFYGAAATALRDAPFAGTYVMFYEILKPAYSAIILPTHLATVTEHSTLVNIASSVTAGVVSTAITQPFDVLKTRLQLKPAEYRNSVYGFLKIAREEGAHGFFIGLIPRVVRKSFSSAITWTVYEEVSRLLTRTYYQGNDGAGASSSPASPS